MSQRPQAIRCPRCAEKVELTLSIDPVLTYTHSARKGFLTARVGMSAACVCGATPGTTAST